MPKYGIGATSPYAKRGLIMSLVNVAVEPPITDFLFRKAAVKKVPLSGAFELTPVCNMACKMCYVRMTQKQQEKIQPLRTANEWISLAKEAKERGTLYLLLTGGEPFSREDFPEIQAKIHEMGFLCSINSNGTMIDEKTVAWLSKTPPLRINMTIYGASDQTYGELCGNPEGFSQLKRAIALLKEAGIMVKLNCSVTPWNAKDLDAMIQFAMDEQLIIQPTSYMFPPIRRDASMIGKNARFTPEEAAYYAARIESLLNGEERFVERVKNMEPIALSTDFEECEDTTGDIIRCRAGKCSYWVTWTGEMLPCGMMPMPNSMNVFETGFDKAWKNAVDYSASIRLPAKCAACEAKDQCKSCAAMVYTESGSFDKVPEYRCNMYGHYNSACQQVAAEIIRK